MLASARSITDAERQMFDDLAQARQSDAAPALWRLSAIDRLMRDGLPNRRVEAFRYSDLRARLKEWIGPAPKPSAQALATVSSVLNKACVSDARRLVVVDGHFIAALSDLRDMEPGLVIEDDTGALHAPDDPMLDLNAAFHGDGFCVRVADGIHLSRPLHIVLLSADQSARGRFARNHVHIGAGARASVIETRAEDSAGFGNSLLALDLGEGAEVDYAFRALSGVGTDVASLIVRQAANTCFRGSAFVSGTPFLRRQIFSVLAGEGSQFSLSGAAMLAASQHADNTMVVTHDAPHCESRETFKYILADAAQGVFQGKIVVPSHAQKTDGKMMCRALILSDDAAMAAKPELEIFADDVACGHGASCGRLDESLLFYLQSRAIPRAQAEAMLIEAFAAEAFEHLESDALRAVLVGDLERALEARA